VLALCVAVHLATVIFAVQGGLSAAENLGRTRGNTAWLDFYLVFVVAAAVHAPIGLRAILTEWLKWRGFTRDLAVAAFAVLIAWMGLSAAFSVFR
jgi:fumarate reductase subunit C